LYSRRTNSRNFSGVCSRCLHSCGLPILTYRTSSPDTAEQRASARSTYSTISEESSRKSGIPNLAGIVINVISSPIPNISFGHYPGHNKRVASPFINTATSILFQSNQYSPSVGERSYSDNGYPRLLELKKIWDPTNRFPSPIKRVASGVD
jgi:hypothetical protein